MPDRPAGSRSSQSAPAAPAGRARYSRHAPPPPPAPGPALDVVVIGGGPGGLYAAMLLKKMDPRHRIRVYERNAPSVTFGFGVVFSAETLGNLEAADPETFAEIEAHFRYWDDIDTHVHGEVVTSTGHGFCGFARGKLLEILQRRCAELGVELYFEHEVASVHDFPEADLILASDGVNSRVREELAEVFRPQVDFRPNRFTWLGTRRPMDAFTFVFVETEHGPFAAHCYPYAEDIATFIIECTEETWRAAGMADSDGMDEAATVALGERVFADFLDGHELITNRSIWRQFPNIKCETWHDGRVVLLGDAVHTAHFSIGSGTKLAMEDAISLVDALREQGTADLPAALDAYEDARWVEVAKTQKVAQTSLRWFEELPRQMAMRAPRFNFSLLTRSKQITWDNLERRDEDYIASLRAWLAEDMGTPTSVDGSAPPPVFSPFRLREMDLANRIVVSPMCQYAAEEGLPDDWHLVHLGSRAVGGAGLIVTEMTDVSPEARITPGCTGMWSEAHATAWRRVVEFVHQRSQAKIALQLAHAGRKGATQLGWEGYDEPLPADGWEILAASALPYYPHSQVPRAMTRADMDALTADFVRAAELAESAGFDMLEIHWAHGYLLGSFVSPLTNQRNDAYGGDLAGRIRYPLEVFDAVRRVWPARKPMSVRISATDWVPGGTTGDDAVAIAKILAERECDLVDVSAGQTVPYALPDYGRMFQVPFAERIKREVPDIAVMTVGAIQHADHANTVLAAGRADLCALARPHLSDPYLALHAASRYRFHDQYWPEPYLTVKPRPRIERTRQADRRRERLPVRERRAAMSDPETGGDGRDGA